MFPLLAASAESDINTLKLTDESAIFHIYFTLNIATIYVRNGFRVY